jgi:hypothetical protein
MIEMKTPKMVGCLNCSFRSENVLEIEDFQDNGCPNCTKENRSVLKEIEIRSLFVECREWFDKVNGNSYFSARIWINGKWQITLPFQYGYEDHFKSVAVRALVAEGFIPNEYENRPLWIIADEMKFDLYTAKAITNKNQMFKESN